MARRSPQTLQKLERERAKREKRERKQEKRAAVAASRNAAPEGEAAAEPAAETDPKPLTS